MATLADSTSLSHAELDAYLKAIRTDLQRTQNTLFQTGTLQFDAGAAVAEVTTVGYYTVGGFMGKTAVADCPALVGTVHNAKFNVFSIQINLAGTITQTMGTEAATLAAVVLPTPPTSTVLLGYLVINPTGTGDFVGGTTALDDATVVPNAVLIDAPGNGYYPNAVTTQ